MTVAGTAKVPSALPVDGSGGCVRIALDTTPLLGPRTGIGRYVLSLARELGSAASRHGDAVLGLALTARGRGSLPGQLPPGVRAVGPRVPARLIQRIWTHVEWPSATLLTGPVDLFHATNFVLPPPGRCAGVVTVHDLSFLHRPETVTRAVHAYRELVPLSVRRARMVLTPSAAVAAEIVDAYALPEDRVTVTHLGVDPAWFQASPPDAALRRRLGLPDRYFVFIGNLEPRKNLPLLLDAFRALIDAEPDAPGLVLVGPPGWGPALDLRGLPEGSVVFTGYQEERELQSLVAGAQALLYPSLYEGFGLPPLEAFAAGTPVVASDLPVIREVVGEGAGTAALVAPDDVDALATALLDRARVPDPPGAADARRARAAEFTWAATAAATRAAYLRALS
jgi:glycosyltransferase involved in cell wall biosynthesis